MVSVQKRIVWIRRYCTLELMCMRENPKLPSTSLKAGCSWRRGSAPRGFQGSLPPSLPGEKHVGIESVGFIYPIYDALVERGCDVAVANPNNVQLIATSRIKHESRREGAGRAPADELLPQIAYAVRRDAREAPPDEG